LAQAGSGTITVSGLNPSTSYTFTVKATNSAGEGPASAASNSITTQLPAIGAAYGGGFFAGQISTSGNGVATHNLVIGPKSTAQTIAVWKTTNTSTAGTTSVIDGPTNSANMNNAAHPGAQFCEALTIGGFSDWYMPAKNEFEVLYFNLKPTTSNNTTNPASGANTNAVPSRASNYTSGNPAQTSVAIFQDAGSEAFDTAQYWNSTQASDVEAWRQATTGGNQSADGKAGSNRTRAVRRISL
jgi:hypothetical protein